jgi:hypothetical protein
MTKKYTFVISAKWSVENRSNNNNSSNSNNHDQENTRGRISVDDLWSPRKCNNGTGAELVLDSVQRNELWENACC